MDYKQFRGVSGGGKKEVFSKKDEIAWEDEMFHAIYISGKTRYEEKIEKKLHADFIQIRGVDYNLEECYMLPYYYRIVYANNVPAGNFKVNKCFSFDDYTEDGSKKISTSGFPCPATRSFRNEIRWCSTCRSIVYIIGFLCDENGQNILDSNKKPINVFIKGKGSSYGDISSYTYECKNIDVEPLFDDKSEESLAEEQNYFNIFRRVLKIEMEEKETYKDKNTPANAPDTRTGLKLTGGLVIDKSIVERLISYSMKIEKDIRGKFDLSKSTIKAADKYFSRELNEFRNSETFRIENPDFVNPSNSSVSSESPRGFMTIDETVEPNSSTEKTDTQETSSGGMGMADIDDIPF